jgi:orotate phosphoribosyltransferase
MAHLQDRERLLELLRKESVRFGDFVLASGQRSRVYVDAKLTTYRAAAMPVVGNLFLDKMQERGWIPDAVGGLSLGADPIAMAVARQSLERGLAIDCFVVRKEPKKHGLGRYIEGLESTAGLNVVIIDDVCTTGESTAIAIRRAREAGLHVLGALCLVDREMGARANVEDGLGCPFDRVFTLEELTAGREPGTSKAAASEPPGK